MLPNKNSSLQRLESWSFLKRSDIVLRSSKISSAIVSKLKILSSQLELFVDVLEIKGLILNYLTYDYMENSKWEEAVKVSFGSDCLYLARSWKLKQT
jgi:hypothetical protein